MNEDGKSSVASAIREDVFSVKDMSCQHCRATIIRSLQDVRGVQSVEVDLANKTVAVRYDPAATGRSELAKAIVEAGYTPE